MEYKKAAVLYAEGEVESLLPMFKADSPGAA